MTALPGRLCFAKHLPYDHPNTEIMLRVVVGTRRKPDLFLVYLDYKEVCRVEVNVDQAYDLCDDIAGVNLGDLWKPATDFDAAMMLAPHLR